MGALQMFTSYMIQYMDKSVMGQAAIYDLITDLGLVGQQYSWCSSVFPSPSISIGKL